MKKVNEIFSPFQDAIYAIDTIRNLFLLMTQKTFKKLNLIYNTLTKLYKYKLNNDKEKII